MFSMLISLVNLKLLMYDYDAGLPIAVPVHSIYCRTVWCKIAVHVHVRTCMHVVSFVLAHEHVYCRQSLVLNSSLCSTSTQKKVIAATSKIRTNELFPQMLTNMATSYSISQEVCSTMLSAVHYFMFLSFSHLTCTLWCKENTLYISIHHML